ncbi:MULTISPECIES: KpsF/GutQ family sugar-phosphate isomerase [Cysteiniphilum]|uniref:Arabinose 5-phosphate isomerase n=1 Tax=Cysteiniphilum litorale TaxID=2056700 RepID=A0A8J2Z2R2_9GAMM|nr:MULTISPECIES: KpsF/GutQ family sugar-phosphate isomerase [Cysteiniphilum]GGF90030.1 arabinose 5-phosphate isomerase KdsD [Cysteiniphilum litorale]
MSNNHPFAQDALKTIDLEIETLEQLKKHISDDFIAACELILKCQGRVIIIGMGKSGHIASKIAATLASTGTPAFFVHPAEAGHGDFGMITRQDVVIAISNSGSTPELTSLIPMIKRLDIPLIAISSKPQSALAQAADISMNLGVEKEACPHNLAPTSSTTATLVLGDALAIALLNAKNFSAEDFANSHPSGALGKRLLLKVSDLMKTGASLPIVTSQSTLEDAILEISSKGLGMTLISDDNKTLNGIFTDGDLRRIFQQSLYQKGLNIAEVMGKRPKTIIEDAMAIEALSLMNQLKITTLAVLNHQNEIAGIIHMHDLVREGIA